MSFISVSIKDIINLFSKIKKFLKKKVILYSTEDLPKKIYIFPSPRSPISFDLNILNSSPRAIISLIIINALPIDITLKQISFDLLLENNCIFNRQIKIIEEKIKSGDKKREHFVNDLSNRQIEIIEKVKKEKYGGLEKAKLNLEMFFNLKNTPFKIKRRLEGIDYTIK